MNHKEVIRQLITDGKLTEAIREFMDGTRKSGQNHLNSALVLQAGRNNSNENERNAGIISLADYKQEKARITHALLSYLDKYETGENGNGNGNSKITIVVATANPKDTGRVQIDEIIRSMQQQLTAAQHRERFEFLPLVATRINDLRQALIDKSPNMLIFVGHGSESGSLAFVSEGATRHLATPEAIAGLLSIFDQMLTCVVLSACYSNEQAKAIHNHIDFVVGTDNAVHQDNAKAFTEAFVQAIAGGMSFNNACKLGSNAILFSDNPGNTDWFALIRKSAKENANKPFINIMKS